MSIEWFNEAVEKARRHERGDEPNAHKKWFEEQVEGVRENAEKAGESIADPAAALRESLGYFSGYFDLETAQVIYDFYGAEHPFFGTPENRASLVPMQIFDMARELGRKQELVAKPKEAEALLEIQDIITDLRKDFADQTDRIPPGTKEVADRLEKAVQILRLPALPQEPERDSGIEVVGPEALKGKSN